MTKPSADAVERVAKAIHDARYGVSWPDRVPRTPWEAEDRSGREYCHRLALAALAALSELTAQRGEGNALRDIAAERCRQVEQEGWTPEHDDEHSDYSLAQAAATYAIGATVGGPERSVMDEFGRSGTVSRVHSLWPWDDAWFKPKSRRRDLVKAGALIVAEIERLDRAALARHGGSHDAV